MKRLRLALLFALGLGLFSQQASAQSVAIVSTAASDAQIAEVVTRLRGELLAMGLDVEVERASASVEREWSNPQRFAHSDALLSVSASETDLSVEIWIGGGAEQRSRWVTLTGPRKAANAAETLAIRAAEALHSHFLESDLTFERPTTPPAADPKPSQPAPLAPAEPPLRDHGSDAESTSPGLVLWRPRLALGGAALMGTKGLGPALMPVVRLEVSATDLLGVQLAVAGLGTNSVVTSPQGSVTASWGYAVAGVSYRLGELAILTPFVGVSTGALLATIEGRANAPLEAHQVTRVAWLAEFSLGAIVPVTHGFFLNVAGHVHVTAPTVAIHVVDEVVAVSGRPNWLASLAAGVQL